MLQRSPAVRWGTTKMPGPNNPGNEIITDDTQLSTMMETTFVEATTENAKAYKLIDSSLFSGSSDAFRTAIGGYWYLESGSEGETLQFQNLQTDRPLLPYFDKVNANTELIQTISEDVATLNKRIPIRVFGNTTVENDKFWETLFVGGSFADEIYYPLYNENLYGYNYFVSSMPYPTKETKELSVGYAINDQIQITSKYNKFLPEYENYIKTLNSETLIPNFYLLSDLQSYIISDPEDCKRFNENLINFVTLEGDYPNVDTVLSTDSLSEYLTSSYIKANLSASTRTAVKNKMQNIFLDDEFINKSYNTDMADSNYVKMFPFYTQISFPLTKLKTEIAGETQDYNPFLDSIIDNKYTNKFLKTLKEVFTGEVRTTSLAISRNVLNKNFLSSSEGDSVDYDIESNEKVTVKKYDYLKFLSYTYNNFISTTDNNHFIGEKNVLRSGLSDQIGSYRYANSVGSSKTFKDAVKFVSDPSNFDITGLDFMYQNERGCHNEVLAYRVQKIGGIPRGNARNQNTLQNYWLINSKDLEEFNLYDTQVKYNQDYTYNVYAYVLVAGVRYKFSDLRVSKAISANNEYDTDGDTVETWYGLEFYDPKTGEKVEQIYKNEDSDGGTFTDLNSLGTLVQEKSAWPYLADFYLNYEPCLMVYEIPIFSKSLRVLDNPPNRLSVYPYQHIDASRKIGFRFNYDARFSPGMPLNKFPKVITNADNKLKNDYMNAKDLLESDTLGDEYTVSRPRYIEIFRTDKRPTAYTDFDQKLIKTIDLKMRNSVHTNTSEFFDQRIRTNKKYYYLFRALNEERVIGHVSEIHEAQLVNDGGYLYALFDIIYEEQLEQKVFTNPSKKFKKLIHLQPNLSQLALDTTDVDFEQDAVTQIANISVGSSEDLVWGKTFKVRLTSKKTGKKIDLNITYNLRSQIE